jgi:hypothetical protein
MLEEGVVRRAHFCEDGCADLISWHGTKRGQPIK